MSCSHNCSSCGASGRTDRNLLRSCGCDSARRVYGGRSGYGCGRAYGSCAYGSRSDNSCCCNGCSDPCGCNSCCCKQYPFYTGPCPPACPCRPGVCRPWQTCPVCTCSDGCSCAQVTMDWNGGCSGNCGNNCCNNSSNSYNNGRSNDCDGNCSRGCNNDGDCDDDCDCSD